MFDFSQRNEATSGGGWTSPAVAPGKRTLTAQLAPRPGGTAAAIPADHGVRKSEVSLVSGEAEAVGDAPEGFDLDAFLDFDADRVGDDPLTTAEPSGTVAATAPDAAPAADPAAPAETPALPFTVGGQPSSKAAGTKPQYSGAAVAGDLSPITVWSSVVLTPQIVRAAKVIAAGGFMTPGAAPAPGAGSPAAPAPAAPAGPSHDIPPALLDHVGERFEHDGKYLWEVTPEGHFKVVGAPAGAKTGGIAKPTGKMSSVWLTLCDHLLAVEDRVCEDEPATEPASAEPVVADAPVLDQILAAMGAAADALYAELFGSPSPDAAAPAPAEPATSEAPAATTTAPYLPAGTVITSGWRTDERQASIIMDKGASGGLVDGDLFKTYLAAKQVIDVAWVGESDHRCGLAIDFSGDAANKAALAEGLTRCRAEHPEAGMGAPFQEKQNCVHVPVDA